MSLIDKINERIEYWQELAAELDEKGDKEIMTICDTRADEANKIKEIVLSEQKEPCNYTLEDDDANTWECNKCGVEWVLEAGTPEDNEMNYCPKCGREIEEVSHD